MNAEDCIRHGGHRPEVRRLSESSHYLVCAECGLLIDFRPLEVVGVKTDDWVRLKDLTAPPWQTSEGETE